MKNSSPEAPFRNTGLSDRSTSSNGLAETRPCRRNHVQNAGKEIFLCLLRFYKWLNNNPGAQPRRITNAASRTSASIVAVGTLTAGAFSAASST